MYQFNWDNFTENHFKTAVNWAFTDMYDWYVGAARVGDLCFDFVLRALDGEDEPLRLNYDLYIGGIDDGYGRTKSGYPYTEGDGGAFDIKWYDMPYEEFKKHAEAEMTAYINENANLYNLVEKASEPLHIW